MKNQVGGQEEEPLDSWTLAHVPPNSEETPQNEKEAELPSETHPSTQRSHSKMAQM